MKIYQLTALLLCSFSALQAASPLMQAVWDKKIDIVNKELAKPGANPNEADRQGMTPLMYAAGDGNIEMVKALLDAGANPNAQDRQGNTAAIHAYINVSNVIARSDKNFDEDYLVKILQLLREKRADLELKNNNKQNLFDMRDQNRGKEGATEAKIRRAFASMDGEKKALEDSAKAKEQSKRDLERAINNGDVATLRSFIRTKQLDINKDINIGDLLMQGNKKAIKALVDLGLNLNMKMDGNRTLLMDFVTLYPFKQSLTDRWENLTRMKKGILEGAQILIDLGVPVSARDDEGNTALSTATQYRKMAPTAIDRNMESDMEKLLKKNMK